MLKIWPALDCNGFWYPREGVELWDVYHEVKNPPFGNQ